MSMTRLKQKFREIWTEYEANKIRRVLATLPPYLRQQIKWPPVPEARIESIRYHLPSDGRQSDVKERLAA